MKLETAYRKIGKHRKRWRITCTLNEHQGAIVRAYWRGNIWVKGKMVFPEELLGPCCDANANSYWRIDRQSHLESILAMASKLDRVELAIQKHNEAQAAIKEAGK